MEREGSVKQGNEIRRGTGVRTASIVCVSDGQEPYGILDMAVDCEGIGIRISLLNGRASIFFSSAAVEMSDPCAHRASPRWLGPGLVLD